MENIEIKSATLDEIDQLQQIGRQTFYETFSADNSEENTKKYLEEGFSIDKLKRELNDKNTEFYIAMLDNQVIGYLKLNYGQSQTELQDDRALEIEHIYVLQEFHGKKVGQLLYDKAMEIARKERADYTIEEIAVNLMLFLCHEEVVIRYRTTLELYLQPYEDRAIILFAFDNLPSSEPGKLGSTEEKETC
ncbi:MAG: GNAT family N-acetyltransferase [Williamsia sp.]|nr:GNAT family N-acetyltransferase [Williamsia sp.]